MKTLSEPVFELSKESKYYKVLKDVKDAQPRVNEIFESVSNKFGFDPKEFRFYNSGRFGFERYSKGFKKFEDQLKKTADRDGIHAFKKASPVFKEAKEELKEIDEITSQLNPFALHEIFGFNNLKAMQWIGERFFVQVKSEEVTRKAMQETSRNYDSEPVQEITYKEYLQLIMDKME